MHATDLIAERLPPLEILPFDTVRGTCCVTGRKTLCVPRDSVLSDNFTDWMLLDSPASPHIGINVYRAWMHGTRKPGSKRMFHPERHSCWIVSEDGFHSANRQEVRDSVLNGCISPPWSGWVTTSYKKHGSLRTPVNMEPFGRWGFDGLTPDCTDIQKVRAWWDVLRSFQDAGIGRTSMETGDMPPGIIKHIGLGIWMDFLKWSRDKQNTVLYKFLLYLLPSREELKEP